MGVLDFAYANTATGRNLRFLAGVVNRAIAAGDIRKAARAARVGAGMTNCHVWATVATMLAGFVSEWK